MRLPDSPQSLWLDLFGSYQPAPPLRGDRRVDVAIVGAGFSGLAAAYELKRARPGLRVAVLEAMYAGYGASGRNGSFAMTVVGLGFGTMAMLHGKQWLKDAHTYMERAVDYLDETIQREGIVCERIRPGFLRTATTEGHIRRLQDDVEMMQALGFKGIEWIDAGAVQARINSLRYLGAMLEQRLLLVDPVKLVREEKRLVQAMGVEVYENTPVLEVFSKPHFTLSTPGGSVTAEKVVFATNAYSHLLAPLRHHEMPAFTYMIATEPLTAAQLDVIGWSGREGVEDARNLIHYYRITPDNRLVIGGGPVGLSYGGRMDCDRNVAAWSHLANHFKWLFPTLRGLGITHRWGGAFSVTVNLTPALGYLGDKRAVYSLGCIGHGVSASHLNGVAIKDLLLECDTELTESPFVNHRTIPWPTEPLRSAAAQAIRAYLYVEDAWYERGLGAA